MVKDGLTLSSLIALGAHRAFKGSDDPVLLLKTGDSPLLFNTPDPKHPLVETSSLVDGEGTVTGFIEPNSVFLPLRKTVRNQCQDRITVGRSGSNDLIVADKTISKNHGWFLPPKNHYHLWRLYDNDSTNGTTVNGEPLPPKSATFIRPGDEIHLGNVRMLFLFPDDAYDLCRYIEVEWNRAHRLGLPKTVNADTIRLNGYPSRPLQKAPL